MLKEVNKRFVNVDIVHRKGGRDREGGRAIVATDSAGVVQHTSKYSK